MYFVTVDYVVPSSRNEVESQQSLNEAAGFAIFKDCCWRIEMIFELSTGNIGSDLRGPCRLGLALSWIVQHHWWIRLENQCIERRGSQSTAIKIVLRLYSRCVLKTFVQLVKSFMCYTFYELVQAITVIRMRFPGHRRFAADERIRRDSPYSSALFVLVFADVRRRLLTKSALSGSHLWTHNENSPLPEA